MYTGTVIVANVRIESFIQYTNVCRVKVCVFSLVRVQADIRISLLTPDWSLVLVIIPLVHSKVLKS